MGDQVNQEAEAGSCVNVTDRTSSPRQQQTLVTQSPERNEQVRSRWTPKPEQILILESIFNSGMVNPPKEETIKIRRLLERFGPVGDANVFYWFQNRRSRSRRRQRQMQASYMEANARNAQNSTLHYDMSTNVVINPSNNSNMIINPTALGGFVSAGSNSTNTSSSSVTGGALPFLIPSSLETSSSFSHTTMGSGNSFDENGVEGFFNEMGFEEVEENNGSSQAANALPFLCTHDVTSDLHYQQQPAVGVGVGGGGELGGFVIVFINGVPTEVVRGPLDMKAMCGQDFLLVHSSGHPVPINEYGFSTHSLQHGESYFLVAKSV